jgi:hypothetical protein
MKVSRAIVRKIPLVFRKRIGCLQMGASDLLERTIMLRSWEHVEFDLASGDLTHRQSNLDVSQSQGADRRVVANPVGK